MMIRFKALVSAFSGAFLSIATLVSSPAQAQTSSSDSQSYTTIEQGRYLAAIGDCVSCHTAPGGKPFAGGLELNTPFGTMLTPNITPDLKTGIGAITDAEFTSALREGRGRHGKRLYPAMPYTSYTLLTDKDAAALLAYFRSIPAVENKVDVNQLSFPFSIRQDMIFWNFIEFKPGRFAPVNSQSDEWNRGAYLVNGLGHCNTCHSPKSLLFGDKKGADFEGSVIEGWFAPNITGSSQYGLGGWSLNDIVDYLKKGANGHSIAAASMAQVVVNSTSKMTDDDLKAISVYLKSLPSSDEKKPEPIPVNDPRMVAGAAIYKDNCAACHRDSGEGTSGLFPRLDGSSNVRSQNALTSIRKIIRGSRAVATDDAPTAPAMPSFGWRLNDQQIADVVTYIRNTWSNSGTHVSSEDVKKVRRAELK